LPLRDVLAPALDILIPLGPNGVDYGFHPPFDGTDRYSHCFFQPFLHSCLIDFHHFLVCIPIGFRLFLPFSLGCLPLGFRLRLVGFPVDFHL
jgi:hypothetical protein